MHDGDNLLHLLLHREETRVLLRTDLAAQPAGILLRKKSLGHKDEEINIEREGDQEDDQRCPLVIDDPAQAAFILRREPGKVAFAGAVKPALLHLAVRLQKLGRKHGRGRERNHKRNGNGRGKRDRELTKQPAHDAAHQQDRDEHRDQRGGHAQHGKADLARARHRGVEGAQAFFQVTRDVLDDHDRIVDHKAGRDGQRHQAQVVERVAEQVHHAEGTQQR